MPYTSAEMQQLGIEVEVEDYFSITFIAHSGLPVTLQQQGLADFCQRLIDLHLLAFITHSDADINYEACHQFIFSYNIDRGCAWVVLFEWGQDHVVCIPFDHEGIELTLGLPQKAESYSHGISSPQVQMLLEEMQAKGPFPPGFITNNGLAYHLLPTPLKEKAQFMSTLLYHQDRKTRVRRIRRANLQEILSNLTNINFNDCWYNLMQDNCLMYQARTKRVIPAYWGAHLTTYIQGHISRQQFAPSTVPTLLSAFIIETPPDPTTRSAREPQESRQQGCKRKMCGGVASSPPSEFHESTPEHSPSVSAQKRPISPTKAEQIEKVKKDSLQALARMARQRIREEKQLKEAFAKSKTEAVQPRVDPIEEEQICITIHRSKAQKKISMQPPSEELDEPTLKALQESLKEQRTKHRQRPTHIEEAGRSMPPPLSTPLEEPIIAEPSHYSPQEAEEVQEQWSDQFFADQPEEMPPPAAALQITKELKKKKKKKPTPPSA